MSKTHTITINAGRIDERTEVVKPVRVKGNMTFVYRIVNGRVVADWVRTDRIQVAA